MDWKAASVELSKKLDPAHVNPPKQYGPRRNYRKTRAQVCADLRRLAWTL